MKVEVAYIEEPPFGWTEAGTQAAGVRGDQIVLFDQQADAIDALLTGRIDAYAKYGLTDSKIDPVVSA